MYPKEQSVSRHFTRKRLRGKGRFSLCWERGRRRARAARASPPGLTQTRPPPQLAGAADRKGGLHQAGRPGLRWSTPTLAGQQVPGFSRLLEMAVNRSCPVLELHMYPPNYLFEIIVGTELK